MRPTDTTTAYGWELRCTRGTSDKFYRLLLAPSTDKETAVKSWMVLKHYGRVGTAGQFRTSFVSSQGAALTVARETTDEKVDKGYELSRDLTPFTVDARDVAELQSEPDAPSSRGLRERLVGDFKSESMRAGHARLEAAR